MWGKLVACAWAFGFWHWVESVAAAYVMLLLVAWIAGWKSLQSTLVRAFLIAFSISAGIAVGALCDIWQVKEHLGFTGANDLVASVAAGSFATAVTLYLVIVVIQLPAINRGMREALQRDLFGVPHLDIRKAALEHTLDELHDFATDNANYPLVLCNRKPDEKPVAIDRDKMVEIALGLVLGRACAGNAVADTLEQLDAWSSTQFRYVLLLQEAGSGYAVAGAATRFDFDRVVRPTGLAKPDQNVTRYIADMLDYNQPVIFELFGFVTTRIKSGDDIAAMIAGMVKARENRALIAGHGGAVLGIGNLWKLVGVAHGYEMKKADEA